MNEMKGGGKTLIFLLELEIYGLIILQLWFLWFPCDRKIFHDIVIVS